MILVLKVVSEPSHMVVFLLHCNVWVFGQTHHHQLHEMSDRALLWERLQQVLQEDVLMETNLRLFFQT